MNDEGRRLQFAEETPRPAASGRGLLPLLHELEGGLRRHFPDAALTVDGRLRDWRDNLLGGIDLAALPQRRGLEPQLRHVASPLALALNSFLPWCGRAADLELAGLGGFTELRFLLLCPTGARGTPPSVTVLARGPGVAVAVETLAFDYLRRPERRLAPGYRTLPVPPGLHAWRRALDEADSGRVHVRHLSLPRLFKLALALERNFATVERRLLYLFLEPPEDPEVGPFARHRKELAWLAGCTRGSSVRFAFEPFFGLWERWRAQAPTPQLRGVAGSLLQRYRAPLTRRQGPVLVRFADGCSVPGARHAGER